MRLLQTEDIQGIHDLYPASEIESIEVFEKLAGSLPGEIDQTKKFDEIFEYNVLFRLWNFYT
jgi:hypothetical protein